MLDTSPARVRDVNSNQACQQDAAASNARAAGVEQRIAEAGRRLAAAEERAAGADMRATVATAKAAAAEDRLADAQCELMGAQYDAHDAAEAAGRAQARFWEEQRLACLSSIAAMHGGAAYCQVLRPRPAEEVATWLLSLALAIQAFGQATVPRASV